MTSRTSFKWTAEAIAVLIAGRDAGKSAEEIGSQLDPAHTGSPSRSAVCGKAARLGLPPMAATGGRRKHHRTPQRGEAAKSTPATAPIQPGAGAGGAKTRATRFRPRIDFRGARPAPEGHATGQRSPLVSLTPISAPRGIPLLALEPWACRWPDGTGPYLFCGCQQEAGSSYCAAHTAEGMQARK